MTLTFAGELTKMIDAGLGRETTAPDTSVAVGRYSEYIEVSDAAVATFDTNAALPLRALTVNIEPVQEGTGDPSPENVRPITGRQNVTVTRTGENLWDEEWESGAFNADTGEEVSNENWSRSSEYISVVSDTTYYCYVEEIDSTHTFYVFVYDINKNFIGHTEAKAQSFTFNVPSNGAYVRIQYKRSIADVTGYKVSINYPSTDHDYHTSDITSITFPLGQTVYGGVLDATAGTLTVTMANIASYDGETLPGKWISDRDVYAPDTTPTTGAQVVYELAEPVDVELTPQQIETLIGTNNVWSDGGNVSLTYTKYNYTEGY